MCDFQVVPVATDTLNVVKEKVVEAAHAGVEKTQEVYNEYVLPTAQAGIEKTQEMYNEYVAPSAAAGRHRSIPFVFIIACLFRCRSHQSSCEHFESDARVKT